MKRAQKIKLIPFENIHNDLMKKSGYKKAYEELKPEFTIIKAIIAARGKQGLTQRDLAKRIGMTQSSVARFEAGRANPRLSSLKKLVSGLGLKLAVL